MRLETFISQLLYRYQCVTVPGFGSFITESKPAKLSEDGL
ncbi:MAG: SPOR domain-containing protein, partial [Flavobacterium sp.]